MLYQIHKNLSNNMCRYLEAKKVWLTLGNKISLFLQEYPLDNLVLQWLKAGVVPVRGLATYAPSVSFGHPKHCFFDSLDTRKFRSGFADDDNFRR